MTIVEAGARRDLGELDAALRTLENAPLRSKTRADWVVRLRYAYADTLHAAGRTPEALEWFHRTIAIDSDQITDAERARRASSRTARSPTRARSRRCASGSLDEPASRPQAPRTAQGPVATGRWQATLARPRASCRPCSSRRWSR